MIEKLPNGKIKYRLSDYLTKFLDDKVKQPFEEHPKTDSWQREVIEAYAKADFKQIGDITGRGQALFNEPFKELTAEDRVLVYCYDGHLQQHLVSQLYIFENHTDIFQKYLFQSSQSVVFIDFGCGPLTSGLALARYFAESPKSNGELLRFNYIGIDSANAMLEKAREFSRYPNLVSQESTFDFIQKVDELSIQEELFSFIDACISHSSSIFLNFSYFFASPSLKVDGLTKMVTNLLSKYSQSDIAILFQNPQAVDPNRNWDRFAKEMSAFQSVVDGEVKVTICYDKITGWRLDERSIQLYYDIRIREGGRP